MVLQIGYNMLKYYGISFPTNKQGLIILNKILIPEHINNTSLLRELIINEKIWDNCIESKSASNLINNFSSMVKIIQGGLKYNNIPDSVITNILIKFEQFVAIRRLSDFGNIKKNNPTWRQINKIFKEFMMHDIPNIPKVVCGEIIMDMNDLYKINKCISPHFETLGKRNISSNIRKYFKKMNQLGKWLEWSCQTYVENQNLIKHHTSFRESNNKINFLIPPSKNLFLNDLIFKNMQRMKKIDTP